MSPNRPLQFAAFMLILSLAGDALAQGVPTAPSHNIHPPSKNPWTFTLIMDGYIIPDQESYANPNFIADHGWLHLEARYNSENLRTGSAWIGYNFTAGKKLILNATPMIGGVFGRTNGVAPGCEASLIYKRVEASISNEFVFATDKSGSFYYDWPQVTYSPSTGCNSASWRNGPRRTGAHSTPNPASSSASPTGTWTSPATSSTQDWPLQP